MNFVAYHCHLPGHILENLQGIGVGRAAAVILEGVTEIPCNHNIWRRLFACKTKVVFLNHSSMMIFVGKCPNFRCLRNSVITAYATVQVLHNFRPVGVGSALTALTVPNENLISVFS